MSTDRLIQLVLGLIASGGLAFGGVQSSNQTTAVDTLVQLAGNYADEVETLERALEECNDGRLD